MKIAPSTTRLAALAIGISICLPVGRPVPLVGVLAVTSVVLSSRSMAQNASVSASMKPALAICALGTLQVVLGLARQNPGAEAAFPALILGPAVFASFIWAADRSMILRIDRAILIAIPLASVQVIIGALMPDSSILGVLEPAGNSTLVDGVSRVSSIAIGSLVGGAPYIAFRVFATGEGRVHLDLRHVAFFLSSVATVLSGRAALILIWLIAVVVSLAAGRRRRRLGQRNWRRRSLLPSVMVIFATAIAASAVASVSGVSLLGSVGAAVEKLLTTAQASSSNVRVEQSVELFEGWLQYPLFGAGAGAVLDDFNRNATNPWEFESQLFLWLFNGGLLSLMGLGWVLVVSRRMFKRALAESSADDYVYVLASVAASTSVLVANLSNPYLRAIGHQWALFLPFIVIAGTKSSASANKTDRRESDRPREDCPRVALQETDRPVS